MNRLSTITRLLFCFLITLFPPLLFSQIAVDTQDQLRKLMSEDRDEIRAAIKKLSELGDEAAIPALQAFARKQLRAVKYGQLIIVNEAETTATDLFTGAGVKFNRSDLIEPRSNNALVNEADAAVIVLQIQSKSTLVRLTGAKNLATRPDSPTDFEPLLRKIFAQEQNAAVREQLEIALARIDIDGKDATKRIEAISLLVRIGNTGIKQSLEKILAKDKNMGVYLEPNELLRSKAQQALEGILWTEKVNNFINNIFFGLSYGSLLLVAAIGLAITFGLMGVINMAHGEMIMLGAFAAFTVQEIFKIYFPGAFAFYLLAALPCAFLVAACVGVAMERTVVRHLYRRPLDSMLATWGISLVLIQAVRVVFGANNQAFTSPEFLVGSTQILGGVIIQSNRVAIILFTATVVTVVWILLRKTSLGLQLRAVTLDRNMASCMGISTARVDMWTFALGSGIAGLAGVALSQVGVTVNPEMGQSIIIDCFMVVVLGGVGNILGTVLGALTIGILSKFLEPSVGAALSKVVLLLLIIIFIQLRPQGMFALRGRSAEN